MSDQDILGQSDKLQIASLNNTIEILNKELTSNNDKLDHLAEKLGSVSALLALLIDTDNELLVAAKHLLELIQSELEL